LCTLSASRGQPTAESAVDGAGKEALGHTLTNPPRNKGQTHQQSTSFAESSGSGRPSPLYGVNFATELHMIIRESKYLDRMGFQVPEAALNVALQEDKYHKYIQDMHLMLKNYDALVDSLTQVETRLLSR
ncbi:unnamed protein product, partial [Ectocarpus sp. 12 AP-2014]